MTDFSEGTKVYALRAPRITGKVAPTRKADDPKYRPEFVEVVIDQGGPNRYFKPEDLGASG